ncbi:hypothetical protein SprV_0602107700 [Sparganum proliferum]
MRSGSVIGGEEGSRAYDGGGGGGGGGGSSSRSRWFSLKVLVGEAFDEMAPDGVLRVALQPEQHRVNPVVLREKSSRQYGDSASGRATPPELEGDFGTEVHYKCGARGTLTAGGD